MTALLIIALIAVIGSVIFWIIEINNGMRHAKAVMADGRLSSRLTAPFRIMFGFWPFIADLIITSFFLSFFGIQGTIGFAVGALASDVFSVWILLKMKKWNTIVTPTKE